MNRGAERAREAVREGAEEAQRRLNTGRERVSEGLHRGAQKLRDSVHRIPGGERTQGMARKAADRMSDAASYIGQHDTNEMVDDVRGMIRRNPGQSLLAAAAFGFLIGMAMRNRHD